MEHTKTPSPPVIDFAQVDIDPWNEFLSESDELQDSHGDDARASAAADAREESRAHQPGTPAIVSEDAASASPSPEADAASIVRVSIAGFSTTPVEHDHPARAVAMPDFGDVTASFPPVHAQAARSTTEGTSAPASHAPGAQPDEDARAQGSGAFTSRAEAVSPADPSSVSLTEALTRAAAQSTARAITSEHDAFASERGTAVHESIEEIVARAMAPTAPSPEAAAPAASWAAASIGAPAAESSIPEAARTDDAPPPAPHSPPALTVHEAAAPAATASLSLREVLRRHTPLHWSEAVATVEALCLELTATNRTPLIPDLTDILITADGRVVLRPGAPGDPDVATLGRTLHALLVTATTPLPLRLFVTSSISSDRYRSVALYLDALSYYAAPDRVPLIQALYARALVSVAPMAPPRPAPTETPAAVAEDEALPPLVVADKRPLPAVWLGIAVGVLIGTVSAFWLWPAGPRVPSPTLQGTRVTPAQPPHDDWQPAPVQVPPNVQKRPPVVARVIVADEPVPPPIVSTPLSASATPLRSLPSALVPLPPRPQPAPVPETRSAPPRPDPAPMPQVVETTPYSAADAGVAPPILVSRRPLAQIEAAGAAATPTSYELLIDRNGDVVTTKIVGRPSRMTDMNLQQALKLLKFNPAMKDGQAVPFKYVLRVETAPQ
jgi:hypothetical protein